jgi:hypothetical protein
VNVDDSPDRRRELRLSTRGADGVGGEEVVMAADVEVAIAEVAGGDFEEKLARHC